MKYTTKSDKTNFVSEQYIKKESGGYCGEAIDQLASYEHLHEQLRLKQASIRELMDQLRTAGKTKSVTFRQLMTQKLTNDATLAMLDASCKKKQ